MMIYLPATLIIRQILSLRRWQASQIFELLLVTYRGNDHGIYNCYHINALDQSSSHCPSDYKRFCVLVFWWDWILLAELQINPSSFPVWYYIYTLVQHHYLRVINIILFFWQ